MWLFDPALGRAVHPRNGEGCCPGAPHEFGREQDMTNWGGACVLLTQQQLPPGMPGVGELEKSQHLSSGANLPDPLRQQRKRRERYTGNNQETGFHS